MGKRRDHIVRLEHRLKKRQRRVKSLAIAADPNQVLKIQSVKSTLRNEPEPENKITESVRRVNLEKQADRPPPKRYRYGVEISKFCTYMIAKHKNDYKVCSA
jgi:hypothetical protein